MKPVQSLYLTPETMDSQFFSDMARRNDNSWNRLFCEWESKIKPRRISRCNIPRPCYRDCSSPTANAGNPRHPEITPRIEAWQFRASIAWD